VPALVTLSVDQMYIDQSSVVTCEFAELCSGANHSANYQEWSADGNNQRH